MTIEAVSERPNWFELKFLLYLLFTVSYFLNLPVRLAILGKIRFDLLLVGVITCLIVVNLGKRKTKNESDSASKSLYVLIFYIICSIPFVEWPGSVIRQNFYIFSKAVIFYFFTLHIIDNEEKTKIFLTVFVFCQIFRIVEPTWLHITTGYWGSATYIGTGFSDRLSGAPYDTVNPNGLAFIIVMILPIFHFLTKDSNFKLRLLYYLFIPICIYSLILTQSRSGLIGLVVVITGILVKSKKKILWTALTIITALILWGSLDQVHRERYISIDIFRTNVTGHESAQGRIDGWIFGFMVFLNKPFFGHGLGTSAEAGWNIMKQGQIAHNMYIEILQELGIIGLIIFIFFVKNIFTNFFVVIKELGIVSNRSQFLINLIQALEIVIVLMIIFSFASYGLSVYTWYLFGGLSASIYQLFEGRVNIDGSVLS